jgi:hypothetical protein
MYQWVQDNYPFRFDVQFDRLECWDERQNSVTLIIVANEATQRTLLRMNKDLQRTLWVEKGIATEVPRTQQMAFHMTLAEVFRDDKASLERAPEARDDDISLTDPTNDIRPNLAEIYAKVSNYSRMMGKQWTGGERMQIRHAPCFTFEGTLHTGKEDPSG